MKKDSREFKPPINSYGITFYQTSVAHSYVHITKMCMKDSRIQMQIHTTIKIH